MRVLITGATGFIGTALTEGLRKAGHEPVPLVRGEARPGARTWSVDDNRIDDDALDGIDAVVHLAGAPIGPWLNDEKRAEIMQSRRDGTTKSHPSCVDPMGLVSLDSPRSSAPNRAERE